MRCGSNKAKGWQVGVVLGGSEGNHSFSLLRGSTTSVPLCCIPMQPTLRHHKAACSPLRSSHVFSALCPAHVFETPQAQGAHGSC